MDDEKRGLVATIEEMRAIQKREGAGVFDIAVQIVQKEPRVNPNRGKKKSFTWTETKRQAQKQGWICPCCLHPLMPKTGHSPDATVGDHINPNLTEEEGLNDPKRNCAAVHRHCNEEKGAMSIWAFAKRKGLTITHILTAGVPQGEDDDG